MDNDFEPHNYVLKHPDGPLLQPKQRHDLAGAIEGKPLGDPRLLRADHHHPDQQHELCPGVHGHQRDHSLERGGRPHTDNLYSRPPQPVQADDHRNPEAHFFQNEPKGWTGPGGLQGLDTEEALEGHPQRIGHSPEGPLGRPSSFLAPEHDQLPFPTDRTPTKGQRPSNAHERSPLLRERPEGPEEHAPNFMRQLPVHAVTRHLNQAGKLYEQTPKAYERDLKDLQGHKIYKRKREGTPQEFQHAIERHIKQHAPQYPGQHEFNHPVDHVIQQPGSWHQSPDNSVQQPGAHKSDRPEEVRGKTKEQHMRPTHNMNTQRSRVQHQGRVYLDCTNLQQEHGEEPAKTNAVTKPHQNQFGPEKHTDENKPLNGHLFPDPQDPSKHHNQAKSHQQATQPSDCLKQAVQNAQEVGHQQQDFNRSLSIKQPGSSCKSDKSSTDGDPKLDHHCINLRQIRPPTQLVQRTRATDRPDGLALQALKSDIYHGLRGGDGCKVQDWPLRKDRRPAHNYGLPKPRHYNGSLPGGRKFGVIPPGINGPGGPGVFGGGGGGQFIGADPKLAAEGPDLAGGYTTAYGGFRGMDGVRSPAPAGEGFDGMLIPERGGYGAVPTVGEGAPLGRPSATNRANSTNTDIYGSRQAFHSDAEAGGNGAAGDQEEKPKDAAAHHKSELYSTDRVGRKHPDSADNNCCTVT